jgi:hypothetical protein
MVRTALALAVPVFLLGACGRPGGDRLTDAGTPHRPEVTPEQAMKADRPRIAQPPGAFNETPPPLLLSATEVLIQYDGAVASKSTLTEEEARAKAREILDRALKGEPLSSLASRFSDAPSKQAGGYMGTFAPDDVDPAFATAVQAIAFGELCLDVIETPTGLHVARREKVVHIGHVLIMHRDALRAHNEITRTREEARAEAEAVRVLLTADGADPREIAKARSDCRRTKLIGGDLGYFGKGAMGYRGGRLLPELIKAVAPLEPGQISAVVESDYGFHVAWQFPEPVSGGSRGEAAPGGGPDSSPGKNGR